MATDLAPITQSVLTKAKTQGSVTSIEIKKVLAQAGLPAAKWKEVVRAAGPRLSLRRGRYYFVSTLAARMHQDASERKRIRQSVGALIRAYKIKAIDTERRQNRRIHYIQPVALTTARGKHYEIMSHDISLTGIRLVAPRNFQGERVRVVIPRSDRGTGQFAFTVQLLWSARVGDGLFECGGIFLQLLEETE